MRPVNAIPTLEEGLYHVKTTEDEGYMYYHAEHGWCDAMVNDEIIILEGEVTHVGRKVPTESAELETMH